MKKFKSAILYGICAVMLSVGIACCVSLVKKDKTYAETVDVANFQQLQEAISGQADKIVVCDNISFSSTIEVGRNVELTTNGDFSFTREDGFGGALLKVTSSGELTVDAGDGTSLTFDGQEVDGSESAIVNTGILSLGNNAIIKNFKGSVNGVAVYNNGSFNLSGGEISNNTLVKSDIDDFYGIIYNYTSGKFNFTSGTVSSNTSGTSGIIFMHNNSKGTMTGGEVFGNQSTSGAGFFIKSAVVNLKGGNIHNNTASSYGGAVYGKDDADITFDGVEIYENNSLKNGGGFYMTNRAKLTIKSGTIRNNTASTSGGAGYTYDDSTVFIEGGEISSNIANSYGGALYIHQNSSVTMTGGVVKLNNGKSSGGAFFMNENASFYLKGGEILNNVAKNNGGVWNCKKGKNLIVTGGIIKGNTAKKGGALYIYDGGTATIAGGEFSNSGTSGKDLYANSATIEIVDGSVTGVENMTGVIKVGANANISSPVVFSSNVTASNGYLEIVSELENNLTLKAFDYTEDVAGATNVLIRYKADDPYSNLYRTLDKISYTDATKTQYYDGNNILLVGVQNKIDIIADEFVLEIQKTASDGQTVEFTVMKEYEISNLSIVDEAGDAVSVSKNGDKYSFVMPVASGVKIDYQAQKKALVLDIDENVDDFITAGSTYKFKDLVSLQLNEISDKKLTKLYVGVGDWKQEIDLANPEFLMFAGATISGEYKTIYSVSYEENELVDKVEFLSSTTAMEGERVEFNVVQNKEGINADYTITSVYYTLAGEEVEIEKTVDGTYSFLMPSADVEIKFVFKGAWDDITGNVVVAKTEDELIAALSVDNAIVAVLDDITVTKTIKIGQGTHTLISVNGSSLVRAESFKGNIISLGWKTVLNLGLEGKRTSLYLDGNNVDGVNGSVIFLEDGAVVNMYDGVVIKNNRVVSENINFNVDGKGAENAGAAGVFNFNGIFNMYGGSIANNYTTLKGAGVYNYGRFNLNQKRSSHQL